MSSVRGSYDTKGDVLYITKERSAATSDEADMPGVLFRHSCEDRRHVGVTVLDFVAEPRDRDQLKQRIAAFLDVPEGTVGMCFDLGDVLASDSEPSP